MNIRAAVRKTIEMIQVSLPIMIGVLMLVSLLSPLLERYYARVFTGNYLFDPIVGAISGSISFGIPIASYVAGGELLRGGVSLLAVTAFIFTWTTVGLVMIPLESTYLGRRFAFLRNGVNFFAGIVVAIATVITLNIFS